uniref:Vacuolar ATPase assembly protein VMA22 n=1 Tax=Anthurium amnicola TaxID=1678845 RepID=A0A1D1YZ30_9ARAE
MTAHDPTNGVVAVVAEQDSEDLEQTLASLTLATSTEEGTTVVMGEEDEAMLQFLDSLDGYLAVIGSLSSTLRQGWLELAGARHSMGSSRISSTLFDLKSHSAATTVDVKESTGMVSDGISASQSYFVLSKWGYHECLKCSSAEGDLNGKLQKQTSLCSRHEDGSGFEQACRAMDDSATVDDQIQKKRSKSLSMFGTLVSPKLRAAQVSFETALESIIDMANRRSVVLSAFSRLQQEDSSD